MGWGQRKGPDPDEPFMPPSPPTLSERQLTVIAAKDKYEAGHKRVMRQGAALLILLAFVVAFDIFLLAVAPWRSGQILTLVSLAILVPMGGHTCYLRGKAVQMKADMVRFDEFTDNLYLELAARGMIEEEE